MRILLPALASAAALVAAPAGAQITTSNQPGAGRMASALAVGAEHRDDRDGRDDRFRRGRDRRGEVVAVTHSYGGEWALYNNRSSAPDSYNDWWHDRPDRAFPRWVQNNGNCERVWWSGGGWRC